MTGPLESTDAAKPGARTRLTLRANATQNRLLRQAAAAAGLPLGAFVVESACVVARRVLTGDVAAASTPPDDADWERAIRILGQPASEIGRFKALLADHA